MKTPTLLNVSPTLNVSNADFIPYLEQQVKRFRAGQIASCIESWKEITSDKTVLSTVEGDSIEFPQKFPSQSSYPHNSFSKEHAPLIENEIASLLEKHVIVPSYHEFEEFISPIFAVPKNEGKIRLILNLKKLNTFLEYAHFKMESIHSILQLVTPGSWMASIDLKDAYYSVPISKDSQKYLKFKYGTQLYQFTCYPNGLSFCPRKFTKIMKVPLSALHSKGHIVSGYIDDFFLLNDSYYGCMETINATVNLFDNLGFAIHPEKSVFSPTQKLVFLGFIIDSVQMKVYLKNEKICKIKQEINFVLSNAHHLAIESVARILGLMVSSFPGVQYGPLHYRDLEMDKTEALRLNKGDYKSIMGISQKGKENLLWWLNNIENSFCNICQPPVDIVLYSDASLTGWGAALNNTSTGGQWSQLESLNHINFLELNAAYFALKSFSVELSNKHVKIMIDNTAAVGIVNNMGTCHNPQYNDITLKIWDFCIQHSIWLTAAHLPGSTNVVADMESRKCHSQHTEWMLNSTFLEDALKQLKFKPEVDLFASRLNKQFDSYCSFRPDPEALFIDAFSISWSNVKFYCFPPFSCILKTIQKIKRDHAEGIVVVPDWSTQSWYPLLQSLLAQKPISLQPSKTLLSLPTYPNATHPLYKKMRLLICLLSGKG